MMKKIAVIGAGVTGLTIGRLLKERYDVTVLEKNKEVGGIARTKNVKGTTYHKVGGHCFNSKNKEVMEFVFNQVLPKSEWHYVEREAKIFFHNNLISYPIEFSIKEIFDFDEQLAFNITRDFLSSKEKEVGNLEEWFVQKFGSTLAKEYFIPYNKKIWGMEPKDMDYTWVKDKLPVPNKNDFFKSLIGDNKDSMPHSTFYYPNSNSQNTFVEALGGNVRVVNNYEVLSIKKTREGWLLNDEDEYSLVINTMPLNLIPNLIDGTPNNILDHARKLKYNKVTNMLWKTKPVSGTWSYDPSPDTIFHRHIHIGNFFVPCELTTITECIGEYTYEEMVKEGRKFDYLLEPLDYNVSKHAYVLYDENHKESSSILKQYMKKIGIPTIGRFGEWEYYNMDICIERAISLAKEIKL